MNICYIARAIEVPYVGGTCSGGSTHTYEVARGFVAKGHKVYLLCARGDNQLCGENINGIIIKRIFAKKTKLYFWVKDKLWLWSVVKATYYIFKYCRDIILLTVFFAKNKCDIAYERSSQGTRVFQFIYRAFGVASILEINDYYDIQSLRICKYAVTPNKSVIPENMRYKVTELPWGVNINEFNPDIDGTRWRSFYNVDDKMIVTIVCSGVPWHGLDDLILAARIVVNENKESVFVVIGGGEHFAAYKEKAKSLGLADNIIFTGVIGYDSIPEFIAFSDITVAPYNSLLKQSGKQRELFATPLKVLEYMACAKPVIITEVANQNNIIEHLKTGFVIKEDCPLELARAIFYLLKDDKVRNILGKNARKVVEERFAWTNHVDVLERLLRNS